MHFFSPYCSHIIFISSLQILKSGEKQVTLRNVTHHQSGDYQCEISADEPFFHTEHATASMLVVDLPESEPIMTIYGMPSTTDSKRIVSIGETFKASCVSGPSYPSVNFTWIVNGIRQPVRFLNRLLL